MLYDVKRWERRARRSRYLLIVGIILFVIASVLTVLTLALPVPNWLMALFGLVGMPLGIACVSLGLVLRWRH